MQSKNKITRRREKQKITIMAHRKCAQKLTIGLLIKYFFFSSSTIWPPSDLFNFFDRFVSHFHYRKTGYKSNCWIFERSLIHFIRYCPSIGAPFAALKAILNGIITASFIMHRSKNVNFMKFIIIYIHLKNTELTHLTLIVWPYRSDEQPKCNHDGTLPKGSRRCEEWGNVTVRAKKQWKLFSISRNLWTEMTVYGVLWGWIFTNEFFVRLTPSISFRN